MSEAKFTQGSWYVYNNGFYLEITNESGQEAPTISIADIHDKNMSNANLMAAAPDMYEALDTQCEYCVGKEATNCPCEECIVGKALRKARGEPVSDAHKLEEE